MTSFFKKLYYSGKVIFMFSVGWYFYPEDYERYCAAYELVKNHRPVAELLLNSSFKKHCTSDNIDNE